MAIYRFEKKFFAREKRGRSIVAGAAYRSGEKILSVRDGKVHDYTRRSKGVMETTILTPDNAPSWATNSESLWNAVDAYEKRVDAQLAAEYVLAVPCELSAREQFDLAVDWVREGLVKSGAVAQVSLHHPKDGKNAHVHVLATLRPFVGDNFAPKKPREWNDRELLIEQRASWASAVNIALEKAGLLERVDHRSLKDRGVDRIAEPKLGVAATAMKKRGVEVDPRRFQDLRFVKLLNAMMPSFRAQQRDAAEPEQTAASWWEKSVGFFTRAKKASREAAMDTWRTILEPWKRASHEMPDPHRRDLDLTR